jgi:hypothetical protein
VLHTTLSTRTRPDIAATVGVLSRQVSDPRPVHWMALKRLLRYLKGTMDLELTLEADTTILVGHADADWGGGKERSSVNGHVITIGTSVIGWKSNKQRSIALSSTEAEHINVSDLAREISWLRNLLGELGYVQKYPTVFNQDNTGCIRWAQGDGSFRRSKHIDIRIHHIRDLEKNGVVKTYFVPSGDMIADVMTKPLYGTKVRIGCSSLGMREVSSAKI